MFDGILKLVIFLLISMRDILSISNENARQVTATRSYLWLVNIGLGNGLVPWGNKPLPEPMLTNLFDVIWCQWATMS